MKMKLMSTILLTTFITSIASVLPVIAEDDPIVYTYTDESGQIVNITQSTVESEHWNIDALGDNSPATYENFPIIMNPFVDDFANLSLEIK